MKLLSLALTLLIVCSASLAATSAGGGIRLSLSDFDGGHRPHSLKQSWLYHAGDDSTWADPALDDRAWELHPPAFPLSSVLDGKVAPLSWFRLHVTLDSALAARPLYLILYHRGPVEIFWDGKRVYALGQVAATAAAERPVIRFYSEPIRLTTGERDHVLAVRYSIQHAHQLERTGQVAGFYAELRAGENFSLTTLLGRDLRILGWSLVAGLSLTLMVLHLIIYVLFPRIPENFDFALFAASACGLAVIILLTFILGPLSFAAFTQRSVLLRIALLWMPLMGMHFMHAVSGIIQHSRRNKLLFGSTLVLTAILAALVPMAWVYLGMMVVCVELLRALWIAMLRRVERIWILGLGFSAGIVATLFNTAANFGLLADGPWVEFTSIAALAALMLSASAYLGSRFALVNQSLETKIEEGRQAVRALAESEARYRSIVENPIAGIGIVDEHSRLIYVNARYLEIIRCRYDDVIGQEVRGRIVPEHLGGVNAKLAALFSGDSVPLTHEYDIIAGDGERRTMQAGVSLYRTRQGQRHMVIHLNDVTDARAAERKQREALALAEQTARMASIGVMAGGVTHEINQPLNSIMLHAETLQFMAKSNRLNQTEPVTAALNHIVMGTERISEIIQHMRGFWVDAPSATQLDRVDLNQPVQQAIQMTDQKIHAHAIELKLALCATPLPVNADALQLEQIVINLLSNAINAFDRAQRRDKQILLRTFAAASDVVLEVSDNGPGLPPIDPEKLFDPFFSTGKDKGGTGLGLAIVKMFVEKFKGTVSAENNPTEGATFRIRLPLA